MEPNVLILDIETAPNLVTSWGLKIPSKYLHFDNIVQERFIISVAWKWMGVPRVYSTHADIKNKDDKRALEKVSKALNRAHAVVAHNGDEFDIKWIQGRLFLKGMPPLKPIVQIDSKKIAKSKLNLNANNLEYIARSLGVGGKIKTDYGLWKSVVLDCNKSALKKMVRYNKNDVVILEKVYEKLRSFAPAKLNRALFVDSDEIKKRTCPTCGEPKLHKQGTHFTRVAIRQAWQCSACNAWSYSLSRSELPR